MTVLETLRDFPNLFPNKEINAITVFIGNGPEDRNAKSIYTFIKNNTYKSLYDQVKQYIDSFQSSKIYLDKSSVVKYINSDIYSTMANLDFYIGYISEDDQQLSASEEETPLPRNITVGDLKKILSNFEDSDLVKFSTVFDYKDILTVPITGIFANIGTRELILTNIGSSPLNEEDDEDDYWYPEDDEDEDEEEQ